MLICNNDALKMRGKDFETIFGALETQRVEINLLLDNEEKQSKRCMLVTRLVSIDRQQKALVNIMGALECALLGEEQEFEYTM